MQSVYSAAPADLKRHKDAKENAINTKLYKRNDILILLVVNLITVVWHWLPTLLTPKDWTSVFFYIRKENKT